MTVIEVFADVGCPFTHVGLRRFADQREALGRDDVVLRIRSWPLELVNGTPLDRDFVAEEVEDIKGQIAPDLFVGFTAEAFPGTSLPALALAAAADAAGPAVGERVSLELRDLLFEQGLDVSDPAVLGGLAERHGLVVGPEDEAQVRRDHAEGVERGVIGSPHFFLPGGDFFCPSLDVHRGDDGHLVVRPDAGGLARFLELAFR